MALKRQISTLHYASLRGKCLFGVHRWEPSNGVTHRRFTGQRENIELGLYYYNARYYVASISNSPNSTGLHASTGLRERLAPAMRMARRFILFMLPLLSLMVVASACLLRDAPFAEMIQNGFYGYAIPEEVVRQRRWQLRKVDKPDWEAHCFGGPSAPWNPVTITYVDEDGKAQLTVRVSDRDRVWVRDREMDSVSIQSESVPSGSGTVYRGMRQSPVKFTDTFGNEVVINANLPIEEKLKLINSLRYIGPEVSELVNPWSVEWCEQR